MHPIKNDGGGGGVKPSALSKLQLIDLQILNIIFHRFVTVLWIVSWKEVICVVISLRLLM